MCHVRACLRRKVEKIKKDGNGAEVKKQKATGLFADLCSQSPSKHAVCK